MGDRGHGDRDALGDCEVEYTEQAYNEKFVSSTPTQVAKQESKPSVQETKPADTSKSDQSSQLETQPQPTQPHNEIVVSGGDITPEEQAELERLMNEAAQEWQDSDADNQVKWNGEERNITIK